VMTKDAVIPLPPVPKGPSTLPHMVRSKLVWSLNGTLNNVGGLAANTYVQVNYPQVPILSAATSPGGSTSLSALYQNARVTHVKVLLEATNLETFGMTIFTVRVGTTHPAGGVPASNDIVSVATLRNVTENPSFKSNQLGSASSKPQAKIRGTFPMAQFLGTPWSGAADEYTVVTDLPSQPPTQLLYFGYGVYSTNMSTVLVSGVAYRIHVEFDTVFFAPRNQSA